MGEQLCNLPVSQLREPWVLLRPVDTGSTEFAEMLDSIREKGFLNSISVRPSKRHPDKYEVVDGMYRFECAKRLGLGEIPAIVRECSDEEVLALQIQANAIRPETAPVDYARQIKRIQRSVPGITLAKLASMLSKSPSWIGQILGLLDLPPHAQIAVNRGEIPLQNAMLLQSLPTFLREDYVEQARSLRVKAFHELVAPIIKQHREAIKQGKLDARYREEFRPRPYLRPIKKVVAERDSAQVGPLLLTKHRCKTAVDGWNLALDWVLNMDPDSIEEQRQLFERNIRKRN